MADGAACAKTVRVSGAIRWPTAAPPKLICHWPWLLRVPVTFTPVLAKLTLPEERAISSAASTAAALACKSIWLVV